jgi:hypothetical protein
MKTYSWLNQNCSLSHLRFAGARTLLFTAAAMLLFATGPASSAPTEAHLFTVVGFADSIVQVENQLYIHGTGQGYSMLLGNFTVESNAIETLVPDECDPLSITLTITVQGRGTITVLQQDSNCQNSLTGTWMVTEGTGDFVNATGAGSDRGAGSLAGRIAYNYTGSLSL